MIYLISSKYVHCHRWTMFVDHKGKTNSEICPRFSERLVNWLFILMIHTTRRIQFISYLKSREAHWYGMPVRMIKSFFLLSWLSTSFYILCLVNFTRGGGAWKASSKLFDLNRSTQIHFFSQAMKNRESLSNFLLL